jgi:hypothetical protein
MSGRQQLNERFPHHHRHVRANGDAPYQGWNAEKRKYAPVFSASLGGYKRTSTTEKDPHRIKQSLESPALPCNAVAPTRNRS